MAAREGPAIDRDLPIDRSEFVARSQSFGAAVDVYDRTRPGYSAEAVAWCLAPAVASSGVRWSGEPAVVERPLRVADVGAGTGKLTAVVAAMGHHVVAIEPDDDMRARLETAIADNPHVEAMAGSAEDLPVADGAVDAVVVGQAWHWFDEPRAAAEIARVLVPGGVVAAIWNSRDEDVDWVRAWSDVVEEGAHPTGRKLVAHQGGPAFGPAFASRQDATFRHDQVLTPDDVVALAASRSYTITLPPDRRAALLQAVTDLVETHPALAGRDRITLPYVVECHRAVRRRA